VVPELGAEQLRLNGARDVVTSYAEPGEDGLQVVVDPVVAGMAGQCSRGDIQGVQAELPDRRVELLVQLGELDDEGLVLPERPRQRGRPDDLGERAAIGGVIAAQAEQLPQRRNAGP
jgi:hypothetical protein